MSDYDVSQFLGAAQQQRAWLLQSLQQTQGMRQDHLARRAQVEKSLAEAESDLGAALMPELTEASLQRAVRLTGYVNLLNEDSRAQVETRRRQIAARMNDIEAEPRYRDRELLRAPRTGNLTRQIDELEEYRDALVDGMKRCEHPRLERLLAEGYGTDAYKVGWWRASFYGDRSAAKEILGRYGEGKTFADVRRELFQARESLAVYDVKLEELRREVHASMALESEHNALEAELPVVEERVLGSLRERLVKYIGDLGVAPLSDRIAAEPDLGIVVKRWDGVRHKLQYMDELARNQLDATEARMRDEIGKLDRDMAKYSRPKNSMATFAAPDFDKRFRQRPATFVSSLNRYHRSYSTVYMFDGYGRMPLAASFLWWDVMTDGRIPGRGISDYEQHRAENPDYKFDRHELMSAAEPELDDAAAAAAVAAGDAAECTPDDAAASFSTDPS